MRLATLPLLLLLLATQIALCQEDLLEALRLLEMLGGEGIDVSRHVEQLNRALELYRAGRAAEADAIVAQTLKQLRELESQLPAYRLQRWLQVGASVAVLLALPPLFYYLFPRVYALVWAYSRRSWLVRGVPKRGPRR